LIIVSGPSGSGKSTVIARLLERINAGGVRLRLSVSATTRPPRPGEKDGTHYHFWTPERFEKELASGAFLEHAQVHGCYYGTLRSEVEPFRQQGLGVILDIDVQGAAQVRRQCPDQVSVFLRTSSWEAYEQRLRKRGTESEQAIERRLAAGRRELEHAAEYDYQVVNDDLNTAVEELAAIVRHQFEGEKYAR
jgi:guanylate kinase